MNIQKESITLNGKSYDLDIQLKRKRSSSAQIRGNTIVLSLSRYLSSKDRDHHIASLLSKLQKRFRKQKSLGFQTELEKLREFLHSFHDAQFQQSSLLLGDITLCIGNKYSIVVKKVLDTSKKTTLRLIGDVIYIFSPLNNFQSLELDLENAILKICANQQKGMIENMLFELCDRFIGKKVNRVTIKNMNSRWGSCSRQGNINLSSKLLLLPYDHFYYVCIHELAHLIEANHGENFWKIVENIIPNFKDLRKELRSIC